MTPDGVPRTAALLFTGQRGGALNRDYFNPGIWHPARLAAGLPASRDNGMHALRHFYASVRLAGRGRRQAGAGIPGPPLGGVHAGRLRHLMPDPEGRAVRAVEDALSEAGTVPEMAQEADDQ